jgi:hypothetical protein
MGTRAVLSPSLSRIGLSRIGPHALCFLSYIGVRVIYSLSHATERVYVHALSGRRNQQQEEARGVAVCGDIRMRLLAWPACNKGKS